jgi:hypothetical protein
VDMTGPPDAERAKVLASAGPKGHPDAARSPAPTRAPPSTRPLSFDVPAGWTELDVPPGGFRVAAFRVTDGGRSADVTVIPLGGQAGGLAANVNRWRGDVGLSPAADDQIGRDAQALDVAGVRATYVDLSGPKGRVLGVILPRGDRTWFFKFLGPAELVGAQRAAFEGFVRSVRFGAGGEP